MAWHIIRVGERRGMSGFDRARDRLVHELPRACDVAEAPSRESQITRSPRLRESIPRRNLASRSRSGS